MTGVPWPLVDRTSGFSLTEILVTVFIMALASSAILATTPQKPTTITDEVSRFTATLKTMSDVAITTGNPVGVRLADTGYFLVKRHETGWMPTSEALGEATSINLISNQQNPFETSDDNTPHIIADPTGMMTPAQLELRIDSAAQEIAVAANGTISLVGVDD